VRGAAPHWRSVAGYGRHRTARHSGRVAVHIGNNDQGLASRVWRHAKHRYNTSGPLMRAVLVAGFYGIPASPSAAEYRAPGDPQTRRRHAAAPMGMPGRHDLIDWSRAIRSKWPGRRQSSPLSTSVVSSCVSSKLWAGARLQRVRVPGPAVASAPPDQNLLTCPLCPGLAQTRVWTVTAEAIRSGLSQEWGARSGGWAGRV
jgi:hypothetical protein